VFQALHAGDPTLAAVETFSESVVRAAMGSGDAAMIRAAVRAREGQCRRLPPLHAAALEDDDGGAVVRALGALPDADARGAATMEPCAYSDGGYTPVQCAAAVGNVGAVLAMLSVGGQACAAADVAYTTPLVLASAGGHVAVMQALIAAGAPVVASSGSFDTPLIAAAACGRVAAVAPLLASGADVREADKNGRTALLTAVAKGHAPMVECLVSAGADVHHAERVLGRNALMTAAAHNRPNVASALLQLGADVAQVSRAPRTEVDGYAVMHHCATSRTCATAAVLVDAGASVNARAAYGHTPLMVAADAGSVAMVQFLLSHGADAHAALDSGITVLHIACHAAHEPVVAELVCTHGANLAAADENGRTPSQHLLNLPSWARPLQVDRDGVARWHPSDPHSAMGGEGEGEGEGEGSSDAEDGREARGGGGSVSSDWFNEYAEEEEEERALAVQALLVREAAWRRRRGAVVGIGVGAAR
jgi:uncharacterized protein